MSEYPRMLYRDGSECRIWDAHDVDTLIVDDAQGEEEALTDGWRLTPDNKVEAPRRGRPRQDAKLILEP